jgi:uncharacterized membrane protein YhaH (DUF805 family)
MGEPSYSHWLVAIIALAALIVPTVMILKKAGYSGWWSILSVIPILNLIFLWIFAFSNWPVRRGSV